ncbi:hypothetical protein N7490_000882 [Penicillium lividum]|nr:hypothetical protein N7490_000882 [Penicillium lividum]
MSKDSSSTYLHMHHPRLADLFEEFTRPHTSAAASTNQQFSPTAQSNGATTYGASSPSTIPSFLPIEDIYVQPQYQPSNPEDEDDVVPDQHAAFGITRAMDRRRDPVWRDLGLEALVNGQGHGGMAVGGNVGGAGGSGAAGGSGPGATLRGTGGGAASAMSAVVRVSNSGRRMGGRRVVCLR